MRPIIWSGCHLPDIGSVNLATREWGYAAATTDSSTIRTGESTWPPASPNSTHHPGWAATPQPPPHRTGADSNPPVAVAARTLRDIGDLSGTLKEFRRSVRTRKARVRSGLWGPALAAGPSTRDDLRKRATVETWDKKKDRVRELSC